MIRLALLGDPVAHSRSPRIHAAALDAIGLEGSYEARRTDRAGVIEVCRQLEAGELHGANITMPLKAAAVDAAASVDPAAERAGAANTLSVDGGEVLASNTDIGGIRDVWVSRALPDEGPVLVLGTGGAAAAACLALERRQLKVSGRRSDAAADLIERLGIGAEIVPWGTAVDSATIVNATPLGMRGERLPGGPLESATALFDMAYGEEPTPSVIAMAGHPVADGLDLLVAQAARSFEIWTSEAAPRDVMERAARSQR